MLDYLEIDSIDELFSDVPDDLLYDKDLEIPHAKSEFEIERMITSKLAKNKTVNTNFLGGGMYHTYVPSVVDELATRSEFLTSYTQYQSEASQGILQAMFEYQSMMCDLTQMDIVNSSMYDWGTSLAEAIRMAIRINKKNRIITFRNTGKERIDILRTYSEPLGIQLDILDYKNDGQIDYQQLQNKMSDDVSAVYVEHPNLFGILEEQLDDISALIHRKNGLLIMGIDPISLGLIKPPGEYNADIVIGEGQNLGLHMNYGGPSFGIFAAKGDNKIIRQMPGRIIGLANSIDYEERGFSMIMQTREQNIRRENATSNICTNQTLCVVAAAIYMASLGETGIKELAASINIKSQYANKLINEIDIFKNKFESPFFREFTIEVNNKKYTSKDIIEHLVKKDVFVGPRLDTWFEELEKCFNIAISDVHSETDVNNLIKHLKEIQNEL